MIDFRYHLVSLMAVLIALTMGVILGAGPLQGPISSTLSGQVDQLTKKQQQLSQRNEELRTLVANQSQVIPQYGEIVVSGSLTGVKVGLLTMPEFNDKDVEEVAKWLQNAGAQVVGSAQVTPTFYEEGNDKNLASLAKAIPQFLTVVPPADQKPPVITANAIVTSLTTLDDNANQLRKLLTQGDKAVLHIDSGFDNPADAIVIIGARSDADTPPDQTGDTGQTDTAAASPPPPNPSPAETQVAISQSNMVALAGAVAALPGGGVVIGDAKAQNDLVTLLRKSPAKIATIDSIGTQISYISTPLALKHAKTPQDYGFGIAADTTIPSLSKAE